MESLLHLRDFNDKWKQHLPSCIMETQKQLYNEFSCYFIIASGKGSVTGR